MIASVGLGAITKGLDRDFVSANQEVLREEIRRARAASDGVIGVNVMSAVSDHAAPDRDGRGERGRPAAAGSRTAQVAGLRGADSEGDSDPLCGHRLLASGDADHLPALVQALRNRP